MGTTLTGTTPQDTYDSLIKVTDNGPLSGTLKALTDGLGNDSALALSSKAIQVLKTDTISISAGALSHYSNNFFYIFGGTAGLVLSDYSATSRVQVYDNAQVTIETTGQERMRITSAGNVGIGTSSPAAKLDVAFPSDGTAGAVFGYTGGTNNPRIFLNVNESTSKAQIIMSGSSGALDLGLGAGGTEIITLKGTTGNIGIGTDSPDSNLHINANATNTSINVNHAVDSGTSPQYAGISLGAPSTSLGGDSRYRGGAGIQSVNTAVYGNVTDLRFWTTAGGSPSEKVRILSSGGLTFNGDTAAANALDDYEEGTFTATITGGTFTSLNTGVYTKIGRQVYWYLSPTTTAITGSLVISGLPFTNADRSASIFANLPPAGVTYLPAFHNSSSASCDISVSGTYSGSAVSTYFAGVYSV